MRRVGWSVVAVVVVALVGYFVAPWVYGTFIATDDAPAAAVSAEGAQAASTALDGQWTVVAGDERNRTAAGYTVHEILRGASVNVVGTTTSVTGQASITDDTLTTAQFTIQVADVSTDSAQRDSRFTGRDIMDVASHPTATLTVRAPVDLSGVPADGAAATVSVPVQVTIKGTTRDATVPVQVLRSGDTLVASGSVPATWTDFGVQPPNLGFVSVDPTGTIDFLVSLAKR
ncbi:YceI family protein [Rhodococcus sp. X156]|uniref:YceI family protein n=1 Tax=Rhodococcus sp. X156 TaxID=2499145 RepID=UPI000FDC645B|nr:YceI family protein [Rhodococcus sp. X156]